MYGYRFFLKRLHIIIVLEPQLLHLSIEKKTRIITPYLKTK